MTSPHLRYKIFYPLALLIWFPFAPHHPMRVPKLLSLLKLNMPLLLALPCYSFCNLFPREQIRSFLMHRFLLTLCLLIKTLHNRDPARFEIHNLQHTHLYPNPPSNRDMLNHRLTARRVPIPLTITIFISLKRNRTALLVILPCSNHPCEPRMFRRSLLIRDLKRAHRKLHPK